MKFHSKPVPEHEEVPLADDGQWELLIEEWTERQTVIGAYHDGDRRACYVVSVGIERDQRIRAAQLAEILNLVRAQGSDIVGSEIYHLREVNPRTVVGKGTASAIASRARAAGATMIVIDAELSPSQLRNLEDETGISVCDREAIILNVFLRNARSRQARIQVEIARLDYLKPRIRGVGIDMDQQVGGIGGSRGPGETASELLARKLDHRMEALKKAARRMSAGRGRQRRRRDESKRIVLVGYTNAGKTSIMNALTKESLSARSMPFETLDTTSRALARHGGDVIISDTVGFIRRLPERLLASFESTLSEIREASLLVIVVDVSDYEWRHHLAITLEVLDKLGATGVPKFYLFNKSDLLGTAPEAGWLDSVVGTHPYVVMSSGDEDATKQLKETLLDIVRGAHETAELFVPYSEPRVLGELYATCRVLATEAFESGMKLRIRGETASIRKLASMLGEVDV